MTEVTKDIEVARIVKPRYISLVGLPANQVAFKVIRDDNGEPVMTAHVQRKRSARRADPLVSIEFEGDTPDDDIRQAMSDWGIVDFTIDTLEDEQKKRVRCSDAGDAPTMRIKVGKGVTATILKPISQRSDQEKPNIAVAAIEFAKDYFPTVEEATAWCRSHNVDFLDDAIQNGDQETVVRRGVTVETGAETRKVEVDGGVRFVIVRAEVQDVPPDYAAGVIDTAYGNWGWGQLDFTSAMADEEFCEASSEAVYTLQRVAERIIFYSDLPISLRKELITAAAAQFASYVVTLMDALPTRVVIANRSILEKEKSMSKEKGSSGQPVARTDAAAPAATPGTEVATPPAAAPAPAADAAPAAEAPITRADIAAMIGEAIAGVSAQITELTAKLPVPAAEGEVKREDATPATPPAAPAAAPAATTDGETLREVLRSVQELGTSLKEVAGRVNSLEGSTVVRTDAGDGKQTAPQKDVFKGMFGSGKAA